jgi:hypothetical protein
MELLRYVGQHTSNDAPERLLDVTMSASQREFQWVLDAGFGPLLRLSLQAALASLPTGRRDSLAGSDLVAQIGYGDFLDTAVDIIDAAAAVGTTVTLLKGISISSQYYARPHFRPMSDIDVLLPASAYDVVEAEILARGFRRGRPLSSDVHHHGVPLHNPDRDNWVELHTGLVPPSSELLDGTFFGAANVCAHTIQAELCGRRIARLSDSMQLAYISCTWNFDLTVLNFHPSLVAALFDAVHLVKASGQQMNWAQLFATVDNEMAAASLLFMLSFLERHELIRDPPKLDYLAARQRWLGPLQLRWMLATVERYLLGGRVWRAPIPPPVIGRYSIRRQFEKRVLRRVRAISRVTPPPNQNATR